MEFKVDIWTENTLMPYVVWKRDLPFTWSQDKQGKPPQVAISPKVLDTAMKGQVSLDALQCSKNLTLNP